VAECIPENNYLLGLSSEYPFWTIAFCLLLGALYSFFLYAYTGSQSLPQVTRWALAVFRFLSVSLISFLLLSPLIRQIVRSVEKPVVIIGQDISGSLVMNRDSAFYKTEYLRKIQDVSDKLKKKYEVKEYTFGERVSEGFPAGFPAGLTDIASFFSEISNRFVNRNVGAVILASDGIYNYGADPFYASRDLPFPVCTVLLGDTLDARDLYIRQCVFNRQVFTGDQFPVQVGLGADLCPGENIHVTVSKDGTILQSKNLTVSGSRYMAESAFLLDAGAKGWHKYMVELSPLPGEISTVNNRREFYIEVQETRLRIVVICDAPHPDIGSLRAALGSLDKYELTIRRTEDFLTSTDTADLMIMYQVPSLHGPAIPSSVVSRFPSALFVLGSQSDIPSFNKLGTGILLSSARISFSESYPLWNEAFSLFTVSPQDRKIFAEFPPLQSPFAAYETPPMTDVLFYQKYGNISSTLPLICFIRDHDRKCGFIFGENFWRWRLTDFEQNQSHQAFDILFHKIIQYLSVHPDRDFFRIRHKSQFPENETVEFEAELYNPSYERINDQEIGIRIEDAEGNVYPFTFSPAGDSYYLDAGAFHPGLYTYKAWVSEGGAGYEKKGLFVISPLNLESVNLKADHHLLSRISAATGGSAYPLLRLDSLVEDLLHSGEIHTIVSMQQTYTELIGNFWFLLCILCLLSAEWFIRKYTGL